MTWSISKLKNKIIIYNLAIIFLIPLIFDRINCTRYVPNCIVPNLLKLKLKLLAATEVVIVIFIIMLCLYRAKFTKIKIKITSCY